MIETTALTRQEGSTSNYRYPGRITKHEHWTHNIVVCCGQTTTRFIFDILPVRYVPSVETPPKRGKYGAYGALVCIMFDGCISFRY